MSADRQSNARRAVTALLILGLALTQVQCQWLKDIFGIDDNGETSAHIALSLTTVSFSATADAADPDPKTVSVTNSGEGSLTGLVANVSYPTGQSEGWLASLLSGSSAPATLTLRPTIAGLSVGQHTASVSVASDVAENSPVSIAVTLTVSAAAPPAIQLSTTSVSFSATEGGSDPAAQTVSITNSGAGSLTGLLATVSHPAGQSTGWLLASLSSAVAPASLTLQPEISSLEAGQYHATVAVASDVAINSPVSLEVTLTVAPPPPSPPAKPTNLQASASGIQVNLTWTDNSGNEDGFSVHRSRSESFSPLDEFTVGRNVTTLPLSGSENTTYYFRVRAFNDVGPSGFSNTATARTGSTTTTATRFVNNSSYPIVSLRIDNTEHFPTAPQGIPPGYSYTVPLSPGTHPVTASNGFWDGSSRFVLYDFSGVLTQVQSTVGTFTFSDPTIRDLLTRFGSSHLWTGTYLDANVNLHTAAFRFFSNGSWEFFVDGVRIGTGSYTLVGRTPTQFSVTFSVGSHQGVLSELHGYFLMENGPPSWPIIQYFP